MRTHNRVRVLFLENKCKFSLLRENVFKIDIDFGKVYTIFYSILMVGILRPFLKNGIKYMDIKAINPSEQIQSIYRKLQL